MSKEIMIEEPVVQTEYTISRLQAGNLHDLDALYTAVYGMPPSPGYFGKKYATAYTGVEYVGFIAYSRDHQPVAYYGVIPCFLEWNGERMLSAQSADTMTHPGHRYKGMFVELSNLAFDLCRELGIRLVFGFPNQHSFHGAIHKLGWKMTGSMDCFLIDTKALPLESIAARSPLLGKMYRGYRRLVLGKKLKAENGVQNSVLADGFAGVLRSSDFLSYKRYNASSVWRVAGVKIWVSGKTGLLIGDMQGMREDNFSEVIMALKRLARRLGKRQLQFHVSPGTRLHELFARYHSPIPSYPMLFQDFGSSIPPEKVKFTFADIDIF